MADMYPNKDEVLGKLTNAQRTLDAELSRNRSVIQRPFAHGVRRSLGALAALPFLGLVAVAVDAAEGLVRRSSESDWGGVPGDRDSAAPPNEES